MSGSTTTPAPTTPCSVTRASSTTRCASARRSACRSIYTRRMFRWLTERRRARLLEQPFPEEWEDILEENVAAYELLDEEEQQRLRELTQVFLAEKNWEGCGG